MFIVALNACPLQSFCLTETSWQHDLPYYTKVTISQRRATTVYSRGNNTILEISNLGPPLPTNYTPENFFPIFDAANNYSNDDTPLDYIYWVSNQALNDTQYDAQMLLRQFIAVPVGLFNDPFFWRLYPPENLNTTGSLSIPTYRVSIIVNQSKISSSFHLHPCMPL